MLLGGGGVQGALESLAADPDDWLIRCAITRRAADEPRSWRAKEVEAQAVLVGNKVGEVVARAISRMFG